VAAAADAMPLLGRDAADAMPLGRDEADAMPLGRVELRVLLRVMLIEGGGLGRVDNGDEDEK